MIYTKTIDGKWHAKEGQSGGGIHVMLWVSSFDDPEPKHWRVTCETDAGKTYVTEGRYGRCTKLLNHLKWMVNQHPRLLDDELLADYFPPSDAVAHADNPLFGRFA